MVSVPPAGIASCAFTVRLRRTCSIWLGSALTVAASSGRPHVQLDVLADEALEDGLETLHELVQVESARLQHLLAAQGQELPGERGCAIRRLRDQLDIAPLRIAGGEVHEQEGGPARDDGQEIVEVVGHAARQSAHRLHLPRLLELGLGVLESRELLLQRLSRVTVLGIELG